ncbi:MAG: aldo/keto reductase [Chryseolinea sp.]
MNEKLSKKLALGTVQFGLDYGISNRGGITEFSQIELLLTDAFANGIDLIDTAHSYGVSESRLGEFPIISKFKIVSKFPKPSGGRDVKSYFYESLLKLKMKRLYGYLAHDGNTILDDPKIWAHLQDLKSSGLVDKIGYSLYSPSLLKSLLEGGYHPDLVQIPYNIFDRRFEHEFKILRSLNIEVHTRSAFLQGLFFMDPSNLPSHFDSIKKLLLKLKGSTTLEYGLASSLLHFCLSHEFVDRVVIGVNGPRQLQENLLGLKNAISDNFDWKDFSVVDESILLPYLWPPNR